jgi:hypothetical protein
MGQQSMTIDKEQHQQEAGKKKRNVLVAIALTNRMGKRKPAGAGVLMARLFFSLLTCTDVQRLL